MREQNLDVQLSDLYVVSHGAIDLLDLSSFEHLDLIDVSLAPLVLGLLGVFERLARCNLSFHPS